MKIRVTKADIEAGEAGECFRCAIAIALQRQTKEALKAKYRRTYTVEVQIAMDAYLAANGINPPNSTKGDNS